MKKNFYAVLLCIVASCSAVQPAEPQQPLRQTAHTVGGGLALTAAAASVITGLGWLYSALSERGGAIAAPVIDQPAPQKSIKLAPRAVVAGTGAAAAKHHYTAKRPSWLTRFLLKPTTQAATKRWRAAFVASIIAALAGGTVWGATRGAVEPPKRSRSTPNPELNHATPEPHPLPPALPLPPAPVPAVSEPGTPVPPVVNSAESDAASRIQNMWRQRQLARARRAGARDARQALAGRMHRDTVEGVVQSMVAQAAVNVAEQQRDRAEQQREQAQMYAAELEQQRNRESVRRHRAKVEGFRRGQDSARDEAQRQLEQLNRELQEAQDALRRAEAERVAALEQQQVVHRQQVARLQKGFDRDRAVATSRVRAQERKRAQERIAAERELRDEMVASAEERARAAAESALQRRRQALDEAYTQQQREATQERAQAAAEAVRRHEHIVNALRAEVARLEAERRDGAHRAVGTRHIAVQTDDLPEEDVSPPGSPVPGSERRGSLAIRKIVSRLRQQPVQPPAPPAPSIMPRTPAPVGTPPRSPGRPSILPLEPSSSSDDDSSHESAAAASDSDGEEVSEPAPAPARRRGKQPRRRVRTVTKRYNSIDGANIKFGDIVQVVPHEGAPSHPQQVIATGVDPEGKGRFVQTATDKYYDQWFGMDLPGKHYAHIKVTRERRPVKRKTSRRVHPAASVYGSPVAGYGNSLGGVPRPRSAQPASRPTPARSARVKGRRQGRLRVDDGRQRPPSARKKTRGGSARGSREI